MRKLLLVGALALGAASCAPDIAQDPDPNYVIAQFDPAASPAVVPTPNDLALNPATGLVNAPIDPSSPAAQQEFTRDYLNTLNGFPTASPASTKIADLDPSSINPTTVRVIDLLQGTPIATPPVTLTADNFKYNEETDTLTISPPATGWAKGGRYAVALIGGDSGLKGKNGQRVVGSAVWGFASSKDPLVTCEDLTAPDCLATTDIIPSTVEDPAERIKDQAATALRLEQLRRAYRPLLDAIETQGVKREDIVLLWTFRIMNMPEATFDPAGGVIPFPNNILLKRNADGSTQVNLPIPPGASPLQQQLLMGLNTLDGFSTTSGIVSENSNALGAIDTGSRLDVNTLTAGAKFFKLSPGGTQPNVVPCFNCLSSRKPDGSAQTTQQLQFVPQVPLDEKSTYSAVMTTDLKDERGRQVAPAITFALIRLKNPLVDADGRTQVSVINDAQANALEQLRVGFKDMFDALEANAKIPRSKIALAWAFTTQSTVSTLQRLHAIPSVLPAVAVPNTPTYLFDITSNIRPIMAAQGLDSTNVGKVFQGQIVVPFALTGPSGTLNPDPTKFRFDRVPFTLVIPATAAPTNGYPVTIFSHGLRGNRNNMIPMINALAGAGRATIAIDTVFHGDRSSCAGITAAAGLSDGATPIDEPNEACAVGTCDTNDTSPTYGRCVSTTRDACNPSPTATLPGDITCSLVNQGRCMPTSADLSTGVCEGGSFKINPSSNAPYISGWNLLNLTNLFATRDNFRQHPIDHAQVARVLTADGIDTLLESKGSGKLDGSKIDYIGQSLGGILGPLYTSVSPHVQKAVFNVPGGDLTGVLMTSPAFEQPRMGFLAALKDAKIEPGTPEFDQFLGLAKMILDPADPVNYSYHVENGAGIPSGREALIQYIDREQIIPNMSTETLISAANNRAADKKKVASYKFVYTDAELALPLRHGFLLDTRVPATIRDAAQSQAIQFLDTGALP
jgi:hypothetical protein